MWQLSNKDPKAIEILETLTPEQLEVIPEEGNGEAIFFGPGSEQEFKELQLEDSGMKGWIDRLKNL